VEGFLDHISLLTSEDESDEAEDQLVLMTLHASKGLEFPVVFICGLEQGVMPLVRPNRPCDYEEERRLMYVGITRAMEQLFLCHCVVRTQFGRTTRNAPSMFVAEIPDDCIEHRGRTQRPVHTSAEIKPGPTYPAHALAERMFDEGGGEGADAAPEADIESLKEGGLLTSGAALRSALRSGGTAHGTSVGRRADREREREPIALPGDPYAAGDEVIHNHFGPGVVLELSGPPDDRRLVIEFERVGVKELLAAFAAQRLRARSS